MRWHELGCPRQKPCTKWCNCWCHNEMTTSEERFNESLRRDYRRRIGDALHGAEWRVEAEEARRADQ